ncbi:MAG: hypothetical protein EP329_26990 [Deltaproteobacteria bacterium]|nr:MAG: hypothetical protein EP329_26990 [Deltaproteobacteria bacterium]
MSRRYGHRGRRRPTGPRTSAIVQLGLFVLGLVILLSFKSDIADGAAGCFDSIASSDDADAAVARPDAGPAAPVEQTHAAEEPSLGTPVAVKVVHSRPTADAVGGDDAAGATERTEDAAGDDDAPKAGEADVDPAAVPAASDDAPAVQGPE